MIKYFMPVKVIRGQNCVLESAGEFTSFGGKAVIVTGSSSGDKSGALTDVLKVLEQEGIEYILYNKVMNNPTVENCFEGGKIARDFGAEFVIGIGGGSPLDAAKAISAYATNDIEPMGIFGELKIDPLPIIAIPTTAGTGSEVTPYSILTVGSIETKKSFRNDKIFPKVAFLDGKYTKSMPVSVSVNTGVDAMSHAIESILNTSSSHSSEYIALEALRVLGPVIKSTKNEIMTDNERDLMLYTSMLAGVAIAQTGTALVHMMGYSLTYFKDLPHGFANGVLLVPFVKRAEKYAPNKAQKIYEALGIKGIDEFEELMVFLIGETPKVSKSEADKFSKNVLKNGIMTRNLWQAEKNELIEIYLEI